MTAKDSLAEREEREIDRQLDEELKGTVPASDPPKITRFSANSTSVADRTRGNARVSALRTRRLSIL